MDEILDGKRISEMSWIDFNEALNNAAQIPVALGSASNAKFSANSLNDFLSMRIISALNDYIPNSEKGKSGGVATLGADGKVPLIQISDVLLGQVMYGGNFAPSTAVATLTDDAKIKLGTTSTTITLTNNTAAITGYNSNKGIYYIATNDGSFASIDFNTGDWLISIGSAWKKIGNTDAVSGVKGEAESVYRKGNVNITKENIGLGNVPNEDWKPALGAKQDKLSRTVGGNDNATGTVTDTGANLSVPIPVTLPSTSATSTRNTATSAQALRTVLTAFRNNLAWLFDNLTKFWSGANIGGNEASVTDPGCYSGNWTADSSTNFPGGYGSLLVLASDTSTSYRQKIFIAESGVPRIWVKGTGSWQQISLQKSYPITSDTTLTNNTILTNSIASVFCTATLTLENPNTAMPVGRSVRIHNVKATDQRNNTGDMTVYGNFRRVGDSTARTYITLGSGPACTKGIEIWKNSQSDTFWTFGWV